MTKRMKEWWAHGNSKRKWSIPWLCLPASHQSEDTSDCLKNREQQRMSNGGNSKLKEDMLMYRA
jgi:hypothetical protein